MVKKEEEDEGKKIMRRSRASYARRGIAPGATVIGDGYLLTSTHRRREAPLDINIEDKLHVRYIAKPSICENDQLCFGGS